MTSGARRGAPLSPLSLSDYLLPDPLIFPPLNPFRLSASESLSRGPGEAGEGEGKEMGTGGCTHEV